MASPVQVIQSLDAAATLLDPERQRILGALTEPDSAAGVARRLGLARQRVNYHLRELEKAGVVELVEERRKGNCLERVMRATARSYVVSPVALGAAGLEPADVRDQFSSAYLVLAASRAIRDLGMLRARADRAGKKLATLSIETDVRFATAAARHAFTTELLEAVAALVQKHHDPAAEQGRTYRLLCGAYPVITKAEETHAEHPHV